MAVASKPAACSEQKLRISHARVIVEPPLENSSSARAPSRKKKGLAHPQRLATESPHFAWRETQEPTAQPAYRVVAVGEQISRFFHAAHPGAARRPHHQVQSLGRRGFSQPAGRPWLLRCSNPEENLRYRPG